jgi:hypothetical protein
MDQLVELDTTGWAKDDFKICLNERSNESTKRVIIAWLADKPDNIVDRALRQFHVFGISKTQINRYRIEEPTRIALQSLAQNQA